MKQTLASSKHAPVNLGWREVVFTPAEARRALPYVARIARDAANAFAEALRCRTALKGPLLPKQHEIISENREHALRKLNAAIDECNAVGVDLVDLRKGLVRFHMVIDGKREALYWSISEPVEQAWPELFTAQSR